MSGKTMSPKWRVVCLRGVASIACVASLTFFVEATKADPPVLEENGGGLILKMPAGFERWHALPIEQPETFVTLGQGWFYQNDLTLHDINVYYPSLGFRPIDIEVEKWGRGMRFSAVFVQNTGVYEVGHSFVAVAEEEEMRALLFGGQYSNYRMIDLEVAEYAPTPPKVKKGVPQQLLSLPSTVAAILVTKDGNQSTPAWDFIVHASPIQVMLWTQSFPDQMRVVDQEISLYGTIEHANNVEQFQYVMYSQIIVHDEGVEHVETSTFQFSNAIGLLSLYEEGWQLIDCERNIPLMVTHFPEYHGTYTGIFVRRPNTVEFYDQTGGYSENPMYSSDTKRMIDLELVRNSNGSIIGLDELYLHDQQ